MPVLLSMWQHRGLSAWRQPPPCANAIEGQIKTSVKNASALNFMTFSYLLFLKLICALIWNGCSHSGAAAKTTGQYTGIYTTIERLGFFIAPRLASFAGRGHALLWIKNRLLKFSVFVRHFNNPICFTASSCRHCCWCRASWHSYHAQYKGVFSHEFPHRLR